VHHQQLALTGDAVPKLPSGDLWHDRDFVRFWAGETVSLVGSQVTSLALPITAVLVLGASAGQMGLLGALGFLPFVLVTLPAGAWIDRHRRRPILIVANLGRAGLLAIIPLAAVAGVLRIELLYVIAFGVGVLTVAFEVAYLAYVPALVPRDQLTTANGRLLASASAAEIGGPGLAGVLISVAGAPTALAVDAASYVVSALNLIGISRKEPQAPADEPGGGDMLAEIREGVRITFGNPMLRAVAAEAATYNGLYQMIETLILLYFTRELGLDPATIGLLFAIGAVGSLLGSLVAGRLAERMGVGRALAASMVLGCSTPLLLPLAGGSWLMSVAIIGASFFLGGVGVAISNVHAVSIRQAVSPDRLLGRMSASYRTVTYGAIPLGALVGGLLGELVGLRATLAIAAVGLLFAPLWVLRSPIPGMRRLPRRPEDNVAAVLA
jgi:MFS family permease